MVVVVAVALALALVGDVAVVFPKTRLVLVNLESFRNVVCREVGGRGVNVVGSLAVS